MDFLASLLSSVPALMSDFGHTTSAPYLQQQQQIAAQQKNLSDALTNTNNPMYQQIFGQYKQQNQANAAQTLAEAQGQNRMASSMGRTPLFDPSRGGETLFRSMMQNNQNSGVQADQQARQAITGALAGGNQAMQAYNSTSVYGGAANDQQLAGYGLLSNILKNGTGKQNNQTQGFGAGMYPQMNNPGMQGINWNQMQPSQSLMGYGGH